MALEIINAGHIESEGAGLARLDDKSRAADLEDEIWRRRLRRDRKRHVGDD